MGQYHGRRHNDRNERQSGITTTISRLAHLRCRACELVVLSMWLMVSCSTPPAPLNTPPPTAKISVSLLTDTPALQTAAAQPTNTRVPTQLPAVNPTAAAKSTQVALYLCPPTHLTPPPPTVPAGTSGAQKNTPLPMETVVAVADRLNQQLSQREYVAAITGFDAALKSILPASRLKKIWEVVLQQDGNPQRRRFASVIVNRKDHYDAVVAFLEFEKSTYGLLVIVDTTSGKISGLCPLDWGNSTR
jgi:hypothetical protein